MANNLISVVDDDESIRRTTKLLVYSFGYQAAVFESAEAFLKSGQLRDTSCLLLDVQMPEINGLQLQSKLASEGCPVPIIFISAYGNKESRRQAMQAGAIAFLDKPFSDKQLLENIRSALNQVKTLLTMLKHGQILSLVSAHQRLPPLCVFLHADR